MFTGLIETVGTIVRVEKSGSAATLSASARFTDDAVRIGDSIAINGICLTVTGMSGDVHLFDVSPETLERTSLRSARPGVRVNMERAMKLSDRLGGHIVSGHVDCVATITQQRRIGNNTVFHFSVPREFIRFIASKGSVAIDGISLTVNSVEEESFSVNIIPHTAANTTLHQRKPGDEINIETDILAKYVDRLLGASGKGQGSGVTLDLLAKKGFL